MKLLHRHSEPRSISLEVEQHEPPPPAPPPLPPAPPPEVPAVVARARRNLFRALWMIAFWAAVIGSIVGLGEQRDQGTAYAWLGAAAAGAIAATVMLVRARSSPVRRWSIPVGIALTALVAVSVVQVATLRCDERLGVGGDLAGCDFSGRDLSAELLNDADLSDANLAGATIDSLAGATLDRADLTGANLANADLTGASLAEAMLGGANLREANLRDAVLSRASLVDADLATAILSDALLDGADLTDANLGEEARLDGASFEGATLVRAHLPFANANNANFASADLQDATLELGVFDGGSFANANLDGIGARQASFVGADLSRATLRNADLAESYLAARLDGADLSGADLQRAYLTDASLNGATLDGARLISADLNRASLRDAHLSGTDLSRARLQGADLSGTFLEEVDLENVSLIGATGYTDAQLSAGLGIKTTGLAKYTSTHAVEFEYRSDVLRALGAACRGGRVASASPVTGSFHPLALLGGRGQTGTWTDTVDNAGWEPAALRFAQYVGCAQEDEIKIQRCEYRSVTTGEPGSITRYQNVLRLRIIKAKNGGTVLERTFYGSVPGACPFTAPFQREGRMEGSDVRWATLKPIVRGFVF